MATRWWKNLKICLFVLTECTNVTDRQTDEHAYTTWRHMSRLRSIRACVASRGKKSQTSASARHISDNRGGAVKTMCKIQLPFQRQHFRRSLHACIYSTQGIENDVSARLPNITSVSCDKIYFIYWPWPVWPHDPRGRPFISLACRFALKSVHSF